MEHEPVDFKIVCVKCKLEKDIVEFGLGNVCKACISEYQREYRVKNAEKLKQYYHLKYLSRKAARQNLINEYKKINQK